jgi:DNA-binding beta-propeller fold protein YncE
MPAATPKAPTTEPTAAVLWRLGGAKNAEDALFSDLGGLDVAGERVYVADRFGGVRVFDLAGEYQGLISAGEIGYITDVKSGPDGTVYIADAALHQITMFNADLDLLGGFGAAGPGEGEFGPNSPAALAVSPDGEVFVLDPNEDASGQPVTRMLVFSATGDFLRSFPAEPGPDAVGMAVGPDGTLFIVNRQGYVAEVEPEAGRLIARLGEKALAGTWPQMIAVDDGGNLYVTTQIPTSVAVLNGQDHSLVERIGEEGVRTDDGWPEGEFLSPFGIAVTGDGRRVFAGDTADPFSYVTAFKRR